MLSVKKMYCLFVILLPLIVNNYNTIASETKSSAESHLSHSHREAETTGYNRVDVVFPPGTKNPCTVCDCKDFTIHPIITTKCIWCDHSCVQHGCKKEKNTK